MHCSSTPALIQIVSLDKRDGNGMDNMQKLEEVNNLEMLSAGNAHSTLQR